MKTVYQVKQSCTHKQSKVRNSFFTPYQQVGVQSLQGKQDPSGLAITRKTHHSESPLIPIFLSPSFSREAHHTIGNVPLVLAVSLFQRFCALSLIAGRAVGSSKDLGSVLATNKTLVCYQHYFSSQMQYIALCELL